MEISLLQKFSEIFGNMSEAHFAENDVKSDNHNFQELKIELFSKPCKISNSNFNK